MILPHILSYIYIWPLGSQWGGKIKRPRAVSSCITLSPVTMSYLLCKNKLALPTQAKTLITSQMPSSLFDLIKIE